MAISLNALLRGGARTLATAMGAKEARRQQERAEGMENEAMRRQLETDILQRSLLQANLAKAQRPEPEQWSYHYDPETGEEAKFNVRTGERVLLPREREAREPKVERPQFVPPQAPGEPGHFVYPPEKPGAMPRVEVAPISKPEQDRPIPASIARAIATNRKQITVIEDALKQLADYPAGVGLKNVAPDLFMQRIDPQGVPVRASVSDIGSLQIHDRSGAAVTVSEAPRLKPFVPLVTDTPEAARTKLERLKRLLEGETGALESGSAQEDTAEAQTKLPGTVPPTGGYRPTNPYAPKRP